MDMFWAESCECVYEKKESYLALFSVVLPGFIIYSICYIQISKLGRFISLCGTSHFPVNEQQAPACACGKVQQDP